MDTTIHNFMIGLSNNSTLTGQAATVLSKINDADKLVLKQWLQHAIREQDIKIANSNRKRFY